MHFRIAPLLAMLAVCAFAQRKPGNPLDHIPSNIEVITHFGERADFSPDNQRVAFMDKSFGDAFVIDLKNRQIRCLTCNVPGAVFLRVMHLSTGDYILIGPDHFENVKISRSRDNELWFLSRQPGAKPVKLGQKMSEGAAISKKSMKIAYALNHTFDPSIPAGASRIVVADVEVSGRSAALKNKHVVHESPDRSCGLEPQDFFDNDRKMTFTCYEPEGNASVWTLDLETGKAVNQSASIGGYNEVEGIFPDGLHTCVESDRQAVLMNVPGKSGNIDIWKLALDGTGKNFIRLTHFNDYEGGKASNPVISTDGKYMAFQVAKSGDEAGVGYGILLYRFADR